MIDTLSQRIEACGFAIEEGVLSDDDVDAMLGSLAGVKAHAVRDLMRAVPAIADLARNPPVRALAEAVLGPGCFAVRGLLFDKTPAANWKVAWHQDLTIACRFRREFPGFGPWSMKAGIPHVQPPAEILSRMVTLRIHLDPCGTENGPLRVVPDSHRGGKMLAEQIARVKETSAEETCLVGSGGVLTMKPLILHASSAATSPGHRRVIHLEYAADELPGGLEWHGRW